MLRQEDGITTVGTENGITTEIYHSPDDGGWTVMQTKIDYPYDARASRKIYSTHAEAYRAYLYGDVSWEKWN